MAHLWIREPTAPPDSGEWSPMSLADDSPAIHPAVLVLRTSSEPAAWVLIGNPAVHVNGAPLDAGIRVLRDRDELRVDAHRTFVSTESLATVASFPGGDRAVFCPRCKLQIVPESAAVRCPRCGVWHHQSVELPCWTYAEHCTLCNQSSGLDAGFGWTPEDL